MSAGLYLEHLTRQDFAFLEELAGSPGPGRLHEDPATIESMLRRPQTFDALFRTDERPPLLRVSPFLAFAVLVGRTTDELGGASFVYEWAGPGQRVPVFDVRALREFADDPMHRFFLAELLSSYTRVESGSFWIQTSRGRRRRRFSELEPLHLIELIDVLPEADRPGVYRRLGDLALFLTGVFPDHTAERQLPPVELERLRRAVLQGGKPGGEESAGALWLLEALGRRSYWIAWQATGSAGGGLARVLGELAEGFAHARRFLNLLTDRFLFPYREHWFPLG